MIAREDNRAYSSYTKPKNNLFQTYLPFINAEYLNVLASFDNRFVKNSIPTNDKQVKV